MAANTTIGNKVCIGDLLLLTKMGQDVCSKGIGILVLVSLECQFWSFQYVKYIPVGHREGFYNILCPNYPYFVVLKVKLACIILNLFGMKMEAAVKVQSSG